LVTVRARSVLIASVVLAIGLAVTGAATLVGAGDTEQSAGERNPDVPAADPSSARRTERGVVEPGTREPTGRRRIGLAEDAARERAVEAPPERPPIRLETLIVPESEIRRLPANRTVHISGDVNIEGALGAGSTTIVLDGGNQLIEGNFGARAIILRGGTKRLRGFAGSEQTEPSPPGEAGLYVEADTTLVIEPGSKWTIPNPYGFQVAGHLVIDGGTFVCRFTNGNGDDRGEESWLPGSSLTIHSGRFHGRGDADFSGATVTIYDGELAIDDDLWDTGETLNVYGGVVRNATRGGAFVVKGALNMSAGELLAYQSSSRGLQVHETARVACSGGRVAICGRAATRAGGGIYLRGGVTFFDLDVEVKTFVRATSDETAYLAVTRALRIAKNASLNMRGRPLLAEFTPTEESGEFIE
jgi:hypothetical protein